MSETIIRVDPPQGFSGTHWFPAFFIRFPCRNLSYDGPGRMLTPGNFRIISERRDLHMKSLGSSWYRPRGTRCGHVGEYIPDDQAIQGVEGCRPSTWRVPDNKSRSMKCTHDPCPACHTWFAITIKIMPPHQQWQRRGIPVFQRKFPGIQK